ncbi:PilN domain-containing protein, partial [Thiolapillus sp.]
MAHINLLPWRETLRKKRKRDFGIQVLGAVIVAALAVFLWYMQVEKQIEFQESRNAYLKSEITKIDKKIKEIQACLRPRDRFWDIPVPKIDSAFDNLIGAPAVLVTQHYATTSQARCCSVLGSH